MGIEQNFGESLENAVQSDPQACSVGSSAGCRPTLFDVAFALVLFLTVTDLYRFIALWAGFASLAPVTGAFALFAAAYASHYWRHTRIPFGRLIAWTTFVLLIPLGSLTYSLNPNFRDVALQVFYLSLLWGSMAFFSRPSTCSLRSILLDAALVTGFVGVVLSIIKPSLFIAISQMLDDSTRYYLGRGYGFYLEPNVCANGLTLLMFLWLLARKPRRSWCCLLIGVTYLLAIFLTGSRGGMLISMFLLTSYFLFAGPEWDWPVLGARFVRLAVLGGVALVLMVGAVFEVAPHLAPDRAIETLKRIKSLADYRDLTQEDNSVRGRVKSQKAYLSMITERSILGYGIGSAPVMREKRLLAHSSHNAFIEYWFTYGAVGVVFWLYVAFVTWQDCFALRWKLSYKVDWLFLGILLLMCMVSNTVLAERTLYVALGWILASRYGHPAQTWYGSSDVEYRSYIPCSGLSL